MSQARELRNRLEQLPAEVEQARSGTDANSTAEVVKCAEQIRAARAELAQLDQQLGTQKDALWSKLLALRRGQAKRWEEMNRHVNNYDRSTPLEYWLYAGSAALGGFLGGMTPLLVTPAAFGVVSAFALVMAGWWGHTRGKVESAITQAERVL
jgi:chromosome segregation ATPase